MRLYSFLTRCFSLDCKICETGAPHVLVQLSTVPQCCSSKYEVQLDEFLINMTRLITVNVSLLVFPTEIPREGLWAFTPHSVVSIRVISTNQHREVTSQHSLSQAWGQVSPLHPPLC